MKKQELENLILNHPKASFDLAQSEWQIKKMRELFKSFENPKDIENFAFILSLDNSGILQKNTLNIKTLCLFIKEFFLENANYWAKRTNLKGEIDLPNFEKTRLLKAFYFKKMLKKMPDWANDLILEGA